MKCTIKFNAYRLKAYLFTSDLKLEAFHYKDINCTRHTRDISMVFAQLIDICSSASDSIPTTSSQCHHSNLDGIITLSICVIIPYHGLTYGKLIVVQELDILQR